MKYFNFFVLFFIICLSTNVFAQDVVTLANGEWEPYLSKNLKYYGVASHIVTEAFALEGFKTEYVWYDSFWKRAYKDAKDGKLNGTLVWSKKASREAEMFYSDPVIGTDPDVFFHLKESKFDWDKIEDLKDMTLGGTLGYSYGKAFDNAEESGLITVMRVKDDLQNFKILLKKRIIAFVSKRDVAYEILEKNFSPEEIAKITFHKKPLRMPLYYLLLTRKIPANKSIIEKFNKGLKKLKNSGKYDQFLADSKLGKYKMTYVAKKEEKKVIQPKPVLAEVVKKKAAEVEKKVAEVKKENIEIVKKEEKKIIQAKTAPVEVIEKKEEEKKEIASREKRQRRNLLLLEGSKGLEVEDLQKALKAKGFYNGSINGVFNKQLTQSVKKFQKKYNLVPDGIVGPKTKKIMGR